MVGKRLLHYDVIEKLGEGGVGVVYKALDRRLGRLVAIKLLSPAVTTSEEQRARLEREARAISALNHPSIATLYDLGTYGSKQFLVLEYLPGGTLKTRLRHLARSGQLMPLPTVLDYGGQIAAGLAYAHKRGIIHRDIKTDNVMLTEDGSVKLTDFGLAKFNGVPVLTRHGELYGTPAYMSPEQFKGEEVDERTDMYSFGVVLFELLTGRLPFDGDHQGALMYAILNEIPPRVSDLRPEVSERLDEMIGRMLEKESALRPHSIAELNERLLFPHRSRALSVSAGETPEEKTVSVAVMPFTCLSPGKEHEYLAEGITEDLIIALARIRSLRIPARTSSFAFREERDIRTIGYKLKVQHIVEGSFRRMGPTVRITARLINVLSGYQEWSSSYDGDLRNIFALQTEITRRIAEALQVELSRELHAPPGPPQTTSIEAYELCLKGRYYWARRPVGIQNAIQYFKQALELDPGYVGALTGLADCYNTLGAWENGAEPPRTVMPLGFSYAERALQHNEASGEAHTSKAYCLLHYHRDWNAAEQEFRRAIELSPGYSAVHHWYSHFLTAMGRTDESLRESRRALEIDPMDMLMNVHLAWHYQMAGQFEDALEQAERSVRAEPGWHWSHFFLGWAYEQQQAFDRAIDALKKSVEFSGGHTVMTGALGHAYGGAGDAVRAREILQQLMSIARSKYVASYEIGLIWFALDDAEQGFHWLEKAVDEQSGWLVYLAREPRLKALRSDPRFHVLLRRIGLQPANIQP